jgi:ABC-type multidrug transport system ATPase subunit
LNSETMFKISTFVEQEDALLGVLTVRETVQFALRLQCAPVHLVRYTVY